MIFCVLEARANGILDCVVGRCERNGICLSCYAVSYDSNRSCAGVSVIKCRVKLSSKAPLDAG